MSSATVRISDRGHKILKELAAQDHKSMPEILEELLQAELRRRYFENLNAGYTALRKDEAAWQQETAERALWDQTLMDGIDDEDGNEDGSVIDNARPSAR
jgi:hypothetical protein